ncbi:MAG: invasion associated locus B family protein [Gammaproteobacteria bacterium]|nr:invasion associated locus B family protein [Gammaproteobacteria bacterium]
MRIVCCLLMMVLGFPLYAQQAATPADPGAALKPEDFTSERHGDWELVCAKTGACIMAQVGNDSKGTPIMEMRIRKLPEVQEVEGKKILAIADILTPLGVLLMPGIELQIDLGPVYAANYQLCTETGCLVREPLAEETVKAFKAGSKATVSLMAAGQGEVRATLSLKGFTSAYEALK